MQRETSYYVFGALALICAIVFSTFVSPEFRNRLKDLDFSQRVRREDSRSAEKLDKESCLQKRAQLTDKYGKAFDAHDEKRMAKLQAELADVNRVLATTDDLDFSERWRSLERYAAYLLNNHDLDQMETMRKNIEAKGWSDREKNRLLFLLKTYVVKARIAKAIAEKNDEALSQIVDEFEQFAIEDGESHDAIVLKNVDSFISPIAHYNARLGDDAKRKMRKGFFHSRRPSPPSALNVEYPPQTTRFNVDGNDFSYDRALLDVPRDETYQFYKERLANLQSLLQRTPADSHVLEAQKLHDEVQDAIYDVYEYYPQAVDLTLWTPQDKLSLLRNSCQELASAGEAERLERLAGIPEFRDVVESYIIQARGVGGAMVKDVAKLNSSVDDLVEWALSSEDDVAVTEGLTLFVKTLQNEALSEESKATLADVKTRLRESFKNADVPRKRRLAYIDALK